MSGMSLLFRAAILWLSAVPAAEAQAPAIPGATSPVAFPGQYAPTPADRTRQSRSARR